MKILMTSVFFYPHIGGIETVTEYLADEFTRLGHSVIVVTNTKESGEKYSHIKYYVVPILLICSKHTNGVMYLFIKGFL